MEGGGGGGERLGEGEGEFGGEGRRRSGTPFPFLPTEGGLKNLKLGSWLGFLEEGGDREGNGRPATLHPQPRDRDGQSGQTGNLPGRGRPGAAAGLGPGPSLVPPGGRFEEEVTRKALSQLCCG